MLQDALSEEKTFSFEGKTYRVGPTTVEVICGWEAWLEEDTLRRTLRAARMQGPDGAKNAWRVVADKAADGDFEFLNEASLRRMTTHEGRIKMLHLRLLAEQPDVTEATCRKIIESDDEKIALALIERDMVTDPNPPAPVTPGPSESPGSPGSPSSLGSQPTTT